MSSRALKKLQGDDLIGIDEQEIDSDDEINVVQSSTKKQKKKAKVANLFELLNEDENVEEPANEEVTSDHGNEKQTTEETATPASKKKKKKKKKKGKVKEIANNQDTDDKANEAEDEIDASIREVNRILNNGNIGEGDATMETTDSSTNYSASNRALLMIEHKHLNHENELKRIFGSRVIRDENTRRRAHPRRRQKASWMAQPKDSWPPMGKIGLSMSLKDTREGCQYFVFEHNHQYQKIQFQFYDAVESLNPQNIGNILQLQPYHIDGLIQLSEVFRMSEDMNMAAELIERALYAMEISFHPLFNMTTGLCRLEYKYRENRCLYLALFKHIMSMGQRGCNRTALEFCKFLLSLDPDNDPVGSLLMLDFYAIRSGQYEFLVRLHSEWEAHRNLSQLPNYAFSVPLAMFHINEEETAKADEMLQDGLLMFPGVLRLLLDKCAVQSDDATKHQFFVDGETSQSDGLKQLIALYVGWCFSCWKVPEVMEWLERNVKRVIERVESNDPLVNNYKTRRMTRYKKTPRNVYRHILISEIPSATATIPQDVASTVLSYDPLPPADSVQAYTRPSRPNRAQTENGALSAFLRSFLPNYNPNEPAPDEGAAGGGEGLRNGVGALMDAMRDLLNNIRMTEHPVENDGENHYEQEEWD